MGASTAVENVNGNMTTLAHVYGFTEVRVTSVVFTIRKEQDEVAGRLQLVPPLIPASGVERINYRRERSVAIWPPSDCGCSARDGRI
jgi:hypothetical protein